MIHLLYQVNHFQLLSLLKRPPLDPTVLSHNSRQPFLGVSGTWALGVLSDLVLSAYLPIGSALASSGILNNLSRNSVFKRPNF